MFIEKVKRVSLSNLHKLNNLLLIQIVIFYSISVNGQSFSSFKLLDESFQQEISAIKIVQIAEQGDFSKIIGGELISPGKAFQLQCWTNCRCGSQVILKKLKEHKLTAKIIRLTPYKKDGFGLGIKLKHSGSYLPFTPNGFYTYHEAVLVNILGTEWIIDPLLTGRFYNQTKLRIEKRSVWEDRILNRANVDISLYDIAY
jgi:hypothetical protein